MVMSSLKNGIKLALKNPGVVITLFSINLLVSILLTLPLYWKLMSELGSSLMGEVLLSGFSYSWLAEFEFNNPSFMETMGTAILPVGLCYIFLWSILSGGILEVFKPDGEGNGILRFSRGVSKHLLPFLRLTIFSSAIYLLTYWLLMIKAGDWLEETIKDSPYPQLEFSVGMGIALLTILSVLLCDMIFDYARIKRVVDGFPSVILATTGSFRFCMGNFPGTIAVYSFLLLLSGILIIVYLIIYSIIPQNELVWIITLFLLQESFMLGRIFIRVSTYSCQMEYYSRKTASR
jgi:hypothetical protein